MGRVRPAAEEQELAADIGLKFLQAALVHFKVAGCPKTIARVRLAISSAKGARRVVRMRANVTRWAAQGQEWARNSLTK